MSIKIHYDNVKFRIREGGEIKKFLEKVIRDEQKSAGDLIFIFTDKKEILRLNKQFLNSEYYTDVIAFDYSESNVLSGEIYICADIVRENAQTYNSRLKEETVRVMIHGVLHLCGYRDKTDDERKEMFRIQEEKLKLYLKY